MFIDSEGVQGRVIVARILPDSDLIKSIEEVCEKRGINCGIISTCIGSLKRASFVYAIPREGEYFDFVYCEPINLDGPIEVLSGQGIVAKDDNGNFQIHLHAMLSDSEMRTYGTHLLNEGNTVLATTELVITEVENMKLIREYHKESGFYFFEPKQEEGK